MLTALFTKKSSGTGVEIMSDNTLHIGGNPTLKLSAPVINEIIEAISPTVSVETISGGHEVTITDKNGDHTFDVMDGGGAGGMDYDNLENKPQIEGVTLTGDTSLASLGAASTEDIPDVSGLYTKPENGIPSTDLASAVQTSLGKADTAYQKPGSGIPGTDLASGVLTSIIDDTAGDGDTNKVWSADKSADLLSAIDKLTPDATASDVGKAIIVKTVENGKPSSYEYGEAGGGGSVDPQDIAEAVADWCDENITEDPTVVIDKSLLVDGAAADSKAVGLKVKHFNDELEMTASVDDLLAIATMYHDYKIDESGARVSGGNFDTYEIDYDGTYSTFSATLYSNTNYLTRAISFINSSQQAISVLQYPSPSTSTPQEFTNQTIPPGTAKILICNKFTIKEPSATYPTIHSKRIADIEADTSMVSDAINRLSRNLIAEVIENETINNSGEPISTDNRNRTGFIEIEPSTYYVYQNGEQRFNKCAAFFYTSADKSAYITNSSINIPNAPFKTPATAHYCIISDGNEYTKYQLEQGETRTEYHPYNYGTVKQENVIEDKIDIILPSKLYAITNQEMNLYFANILEKDWTKYVIECDCGNAHQFNRYLRWNTPTAVERTFNIRVRKDKTIAERVPTLEVVASSEMTHKSVLILGDSTTSSNTVVEKLHANINDESLIDTVGTQGTAPYNHEGRAGWSLQNYCTNTTGNPFWNPNTSKFDASYYFTQNNIDYPDFFIVALGINDIYSMTDDSVFESRMEMLEDVVESVKNASASIGVCISLILPPHDQDGFGEDYPARYFNVIPEYRRKWAKWNRLVIDNYDHRESEGIYVLPINMNLDTVYGMAREEKYVNARSTEKELRSGYGSGVHPNDSGYWQIADVYWAFLCYMSSLET